MEIEAIGLRRAPVWSTTGMARDACVFMGLCANDSLCAPADGNWIPGTRTGVLNADSLALSADSAQWVSICLDSPYSYSGQGNLLIEFIHAPGTTGVYTYLWDCGSPRSLQSTYGSPSPLIPEIRLIGRSSPR